MVKRLVTDILVIMVLILTPDVLLENLGFYDYFMSLIKEYSRK